MPFRDTRDGVERVLAEGQRLRRTARTAKLKRYLTTAGRVSLLLFLSVGVEGALTLLVANLLQC